MRRKVKGLEDTAGIYLKCRVNDSPLFTTKRGEPLVLAFIIHASHRMKISPWTWTPATRKATCLLMMIGGGVGS